METRIIGRDIMTGVEKFYIDCDDVLNHYDSSVYNIPVFKSLYLDQPRQFKGKHWRSEGKQYWIPPSGLVFDPCIPSSTKKGYIKARNLDTDEICIYEGVAAAAKLLDLNKTNLGRIINKIINEKKYKGYEWRILPVSEWGSWADSNIPFEQPNITSVNIYNAQYASMNDIFRMFYENYIK